MTEQQRLRCTVTSYRVIDGELWEGVEETNTGFRIREGWLYLGNSAASAPVDDLLDGAREGRGWSAQAGTPPVKVECQADRWGRYACCPGGCEVGWGGRNYPKIHVSAEALLEALEER